jgi:hypothetical protein
MMPLRHSWQAFERPEFYANGRFRVKVSRTEFINASDWAGEQPTVKTPIASVIVIVVGGCYDGFLNWS